MSERENSPEGTPTAVPVEPQDSIHGLREDDDRPDDREGGAPVPRGSEHTATREVEDE